jgi:hypothetical protein
LIQSYFISIWRKKSSKSLLASFAQATRTVLTLEEAIWILGELDGAVLLIIKLLYGSGLRVMEGGPAPYQRPGFRYAPDLRPERKRGCGSADTAPRQFERTAAGSVWTSLGSPFN